MDKHKWMKQAVKATKIIIIERQNDIHKYSLDNTATWNNARRIYINK